MGIITTIVRNHFLGSGKRNTEYIVGMEVMVRRVIVYKSQTHGPGWREREMLAYRRLVWVVPSASSASACCSLSDP